MIARSLSQLAALALAGLTFWFLISSPGVMDPQFAGTISIVFGLFVIVFFGVLFVAMHLATLGSTIYWTGPNQISRVATMIGVTLAVHLVAGWMFELQGRLDETATVVSIVTWTLFPAAFLASGIVKWPTRLRSASKLRLALVGAAAIGLAAAVSYAKFASSSAELQVPAVGGLFVRVVALILSAAAEEVVCRFLLLTALLDLTRSRFNAVFLSSIVFGLLHAPLALMQPVVHSDWSTLQYAAHAYAPVFLMQTLAGLCLGVLWLRTGSISLVVLFHAIINIGPTLLTGL